PGPREHLLSPLATPPDWSELDRFQRTIHRDDFVRLLDGVYTQNRDHESFIELHPDHATIRTSSLDPTATYTLHFAPAGTPPRALPGRMPGRTDPVDSGRPLRGLAIAIDPGHIGGQWARIEWRWFRIGDSAPVIEGDLNLAVARLLAERLRRLGARVTLVRDAPRPVTTVDPRELEPVARALLVSRGQLHGGLAPGRE